MSQLALDFNTVTPMPDIIAIDEGLNPEQRAAVLAPLDAVLQVMAGAGTGKTELITRRFVKLTQDLLAQGDDEATEHLWVSTFTDKAAQEMKTRIAKAVETATGMPLHPKAWIGTFHSLAQRILRRHSHLAPGLRGFTLISDVELDLLREQLVEILLLGPSNDLFQRLVQQNDPLQLDCLQAEPLLALDVGDLTPIFEEIVFRILPRIKAAGLSPQGFAQAGCQQIAAFTHLLETLPIGEVGAAWDQHYQFGEGWEAHLKAVSHTGFSFSPTDWAIELATEKALQKGKPIPDSFKLLKEALNPLYKTGYFVSHDGRKKTQSFSPASRDRAVISDLADLQQSLVAIVAAIYQLYQNLLRLEHVCDYDDLIQETVQLLTDYPNVRAQYQAQFAHLLIDEFQDSNGSQLRLVQLLCRQDRPGLTVVGDKKQSIYGFRFAEPENLSLVFDGLATPEIIQLQRNYRSQAPILSVANRITQMIDNQQAETLQVAVSPLITPAEPVTWLAIEEPLSVGEAREVECRWIVENIADLLMKNTFAASDIAVLVRDHRKAMQLEEALDALGIPAIKQRNLGFFQHLLIQQTVALFTLVQSPQDDIALIALLQQKLTHRQLFVLAQKRRTLQHDMNLTDLSYWDTLTYLLRQPKDLPIELSLALPALTFLVDTLEDLHSKRDIGWSPDHLFSLLLQVFPLLTPAERQTISGQKSLRQLGLLKKMIYLWVARCQGKPTLEYVLNLLKRSQSKDDLEIPLDDQTFQTDAVRILTLHGAKGLEFPVVFLAAVDRYQKSRHDGLLTVDPQHAGKAGVGLILNRHQGEKTVHKLVYDTVWKVPRSQEEERRLFYVGVTRAKQQLYLSSWPQSFPYINPTYFADLADVCKITPENVIWQTPSALAALADQFRARYWKSAEIPA